MKKNKNKKKSKKIEKEKMNMKNGLTSGWKSTIWTKRISQFDIYFKLS